MAQKDGEEYNNMIGKDLNNGGVWFTHAPTLFKEGNKW